MGIGKDFGSGEFWNEDQAKLLAGAGAGAAEVACESPAILRRAGKRIHH